MTETVEFHPNAVYAEGQVRLMLGLSEMSIADARRRGDLRFTRKGNRILFLGQWIIDWLNEKPVSSQSQQAAGQEANAATN